VSTYPASFADLSTTEAFFMIEPIKFVGWDLWKPRSWAGSVTECYPMTVEFVLYDLDVFSKSLGSLDLREAFFYVQPVKESTRNAVRLPFPNRTTLDPIALEIPRNQ